MKYKIGELEVEAIQWNGENAREIINFLLSKLSGKIHLNNESSELKVRYQREQKGSAFIGDFIVVLDKEPVIIKESFFDKMATKVKEPKFKVGDKVYLLGLRSVYIDIVDSIIDSDSYKLTMTNHIYFQSELFTLEEAIEKLKEL